MLDEVRHAVAACQRRTVNLTGDLEAPVAQQLGRDWELAGGYEYFAKAIIALVTEGVLRPVKAAGENGRLPPLALRYRKLDPAQSNNEAIKKEILTVFRSPLNLSYFLDNPDDYLPVREILHAIDRYLVEYSGKEPEVWDTVNERSLQMARDEKFLASPAGRRLLQQLQITPADLYCRPAPEPFFYWPTGLPGDEPGIAFCLVVENKDTFHSLKKVLGKGLLTTRPALQLLIYGEGKKIIHSWPFIYECLPREQRPLFFYFGDLDLEGLAIAADLMRAAETGQAEAKPLMVLPAEPLYKLLLEAGLNRPLNSDQTRAGQRLDLFFSKCVPNLEVEIKRLWHQGLVIPQESLSASTLATLGEVELWPASRR